MSVVRRDWGRTPRGEAVDLYTVTSDGNMKFSVATYGGALVSLTAPDRQGRMDDVILGYDSLDGYLTDECYFGRLVGRVANRVGHARFVLGNETFELDPNEGAHHLHGGAGGFHSRVWSAVPLDDGSGVTLSLTSPDRDQGYPGTLEVTATYRIEDHGLRLDLRAGCDRDTVVNMTCHPYFNLSGGESETCLTHELLIPAARRLETDAELVPTGRELPVGGTRFDFTRAAKMDRGIDSYFILNEAGRGLKPAATVHEPGSGRILEVWSTAPGVQFYTGDFIPAGLVGKEGRRYSANSGFALEPQGYVDAVNRAGFPSVILRRGDEYNHSILYKFRVK